MELIGQIVAVVVVMITVMVAVFVLHLGDLAIRIQNKCQH
jgi:hypothetical protein